MRLRFKDKIMRVEERKGMTLIEIIAVIVIIGILAAIAIPNFNTQREHIYGKEAIANLKLIAAAERIYRLEMNDYYLPFGTESNVLNLNSNLKLRLNETNWDYSVTTTKDPDTFTATAERNGIDGYFDCEYTLANNSLDGEPVKTEANDCPPQ